MRRHLTYANVTATLALFVALGGGAYAVTHVGSGDIKDNSIRSIDLKNRHGVKGRDFPRNALGGREVDESALNANQIVRMVGSGGGPNCDPSSGTEFTKCVTTSVQLRGSGGILVIATGNEEGGGVAAAASCRIEIDGSPLSSLANPGDLLNNADALATNGFAQTTVSGLLEKGRHKVALACKELAGDVRIDAPTIAAIAINESR